jgi:hypothetical protein
MNNFDLRKFLTENKLTSAARLQETNDEGLTVAQEIAGELADYIQPDTINYNLDDTNGSYSIDFDILVPAEYGSGPELERNLSYRDYGGPGQWFTKVMASAGMEDENGNTLVSIFGRAGFDV